jgi:S-layer homology domain
VTRAGVMEVYPNHTFQPAAVVRRGELADAASRVLALIAAEKPRLAASWKGARRQFADVPMAHLSYPAASLSVEAGIMQPLADGTFQLARPVTGAEAVAAIKKLEELAEIVGR